MYRLASVITQTTRNQTNASCRIFQQSQRSFASAAEAEPVERTALYNQHLKLGGTMVPFAGYELPVQYKDGILKNHLHVRASAGLFDVSHMGQLKIWGQDRIRALESVVVADVSALKPGQSTLSVITNEKGGIIDDCIVTMRDDHVGMVVNGACKHGDMAHIQDVFSRLFKGTVRLEYLPHTQVSLVALQGPKAAEVLSRMIEPKNSIDLQKWAFMSEKKLKLGKYDVTVSRSGYTGEDGFEISMRSEDAESIWQLILQHPEVLASGLGARDSLRLEAGLCLYGHDLNTDITPIEAGLAWTISARRRSEGGFIGYNFIKQQLDQGVSKKRVGLVVKGAPAREGCEIQNEKGEKIGVVTSGTHSPSLSKPISMGYVSTPFAKNGTKVKILVRGRTQDAEVSKMPFVPARYHRVQ